LGGDYFTGQQAVPFVGLREYEAPFSNIANVQLGLRFAFILNFFVCKSFQNSKF